MVPCVSDPIGADGASLGGTVDAWDGSGNGAAVEELFASSIAAVFESGDAIGDGGVVGPCVPQPAQMSRIDPQITD
jgi:hypothetical protein